MAVPRVQPSLLLKIVVLVHFTFSTWGALFGPLYPVSYTYMHNVIIICGLLAIIHHDNADIVIVMMFMLGISVITDIIFMGCYDPDVHHQVESLGAAQHVKNTYRFSLGMSILNLLLKIPSMLALLLVLNDRSTADDVFHIPGLPTFGTTPGGYETIDGASASRTDSGLQTAQHHHSLVTDDKDPVQT